jgi:rSAM/selenodomain-associated transferase 2
MNTPLLSIIVPVLNETGIIQRTVAHLREVSGDVPTEIIIVDGDPGGSTISGIAHSDTVKTITSPCGRGPQMNAGAKAASGAILLFVHADTRLPADGIKAVAAACSAPQIAGGAFFLGIDNKKRIYRWIETWANFRSALAKIPYGDQAIFIRKSVFARIGGYAEIPIMEDLDMMRRLKKGGYTISLIKKPVRTSARRWETQGLVYCIVRNNLLSGLFYAGVDASVLKRFYG